MPSSPTSIHPPKTKRRAPHLLDAGRIPSVYFSASFNAWNRVEDRDPTRVEGTAILLPHSKNSEGTSWPVVEAA